MAMPGAALRSTKQIALGIDQSLVRLSALDKVLGAQAQILREAALDVKPLMRAQLQRNFASSGIQSHTGKLAASVSGVHIDLAGGGLKATLADTGAYKKTSVHRVAGALNYGAVRQARPRRRIRQTVIGSTIPDRVGKKGILGDKAKRTLKKIGLGQAVSQRALASLQGGIHGRHVKRKGAGTNLKNDTSRSVAVGDAVVLKPRPFFYFSAAQREAAAEAFRAAVQRRVDARMKGVR